MTCCRGFNRELLEVVFKLKSFWFPGKTLNSMSAKEYCMPNSGAKEGAVSLKLKINGNVLAATRPNTQKCNSNASKSTV